MNTTASHRERQPDKARVLTNATLRASVLLGLKSAQLAEVIGRSNASISRMRNKEVVLRLTFKEAEFAALLVRCYRSLDSLVAGEDGQRKAWMWAENRALGGKPCELVKQAQGLVKVVELNGGGPRYADPSTSYVLRKRFAEDDKRDPSESLSDAQMLHDLQEKRFSEQIGSTESRAKADDEH